jgi:hypothetical protein
VSADAATAAGEMLRVVQAGGDELDRRYGADAWQASELGVAAARGARGGELRQDRPAVAARRRQSLGSPTAGHWLRLQHDP